MDTSLLTIQAALEKLQTRAVSATELTKAYLEKSKTENGKLNAFITMCEKEALAQAQAADNQLANGETKPLLGIPVALKDIFITKGICTTAGAKLLEDYIPQYDGTVVEKLKDAGAIIIGKTNLDAWAHGSSGENSDFGATKNPYNTAYVPGGSSSGSAVAVSADLSLAASGSDTGGSIRLPAAFCNVVGLKPTYGRVSRYGVISMASSLDSIGHFTKTVYDNALFLQVTAGHDAKDATTPPHVVTDYTKNITAGVKNLKIGVPKEYFTQGLDAKVENLVKDVLKVYKSLGAELIEISLPNTEYGIAVYYIIQTAEVSSNLARFDGIRYGKPREAFANEAKRRIMLGTYVLSAGYYDAYYKKAMQVRTLLIEDYKKAFEKVDVLIAPVSPSPVWKLGAKTDDPLQMYLSDILTVTGNLAGIPGITVPAGFIDGLPMGFQILGPQFSEALLYQTAYAFEQEKPYWKEQPK